MIYARVFETKLTCDYCDHSRNKKDNFNTKTNNKNTQSNSSNK